MKARITCDSGHALGKKFGELFTLDFYSRRTGFDLHRNLSSFIEETNDYDITINFSRGMQFGQTKLLVDLQKYCNLHKITHTVLNIGSYVNILLLNSPNSSYDVEKAALKYAHRKIAFSHMFHGDYLDSRLINLGHLDEISIDIHENYKHLNTLNLNEVINNIKYMLDRPYIKELSLQYKQPGNHRVNDGVGIILPGLY